MQMGHMKILISYIRAIWSWFINVPELCLGLLARKEATCISEHTVYDICTLYFKYPTSLFSVIYNREHFHASDTQFYDCAALYFYAIGGSHISGPEHGDVCLLTLSPNGFTTRYVRMRPQRRETR